MGYCGVIGTLQYVVLVRNVKPCWSGSGKPASVCRVAAGLLGRRWTAGPTPLRGPVLEGPPGQSGHRLLADTVVITLARHQILG
jgi:hypothetical protein